MSTTNLHTPADPSAARRAQILDAATRVFAEKGFHRATIREIATVAGVADGTIYNYFANKSALLLGLLDRLNETEGRAAHFARAPEGGAAEFMRGYLAHRFATLTETGFDIFHVLLSELLVDRDLRDRWREQTLAPTFAIAESYLGGAMAGGALRPLDPALAARAMAGMSLGVLLLRLLGDPTLEERWEELPDTIAAILIHGLTPQDGLTPEGETADAPQR